MLCKYATMRREERRRRSVILHAGNSLHRQHAFTESDAWRQYTNDDWNSKTGLTVARRRRESMTSLVCWYRIVFRDWTANIGRSSDIVWYKCIHFYIIIVIIMHFDRCRPHTTNTMCTSEIPHRSIIIYVRVRVRVCTGK